MKIVTLAAVLAAFTSVPALAQADEHSAHHEAAVPATPADAKTAMPGMANPHAMTPSTDGQCPCCATGTPMARGNDGTSQHMAQMQPMMQMMQQMHAEMQQMHTDMQAMHEQMVQMREQMQRPR